MFTIKAFIYEGDEGEVSCCTAYSTPTFDMIRMKDGTTEFRFSDRTLYVSEDDFDRIVVENAMGKTIENVVLKRAP